jgi:pimeloyl-ACP methyl ester carboxylesterase
LTPIPAHPVSVYHVADDIAFLMDHLGIGRAIIGGWSRGATISSAFYPTYAELHTSTSHLLIPLAPPSLGRNGGWPRPCPGRSGAEGP